jgi:hydrogenase maturation factor
MNERYCQEEHCITCSDEAQEARVLHIYQEQETALVALDNTMTDEVDISLVEHVIPGDLLLVHGGVAISRLEEGDHE